MKVEVLSGSLRWMALAACLLLAGVGAVHAGDAAAPPAGTEQGDDAWEEEDEYAQPAVRDPLERYNRTIFKFNDGVYRHVMRPLSRGYETITPAVLRRGLTSFFDNIRFPVRFASCVLQGKLDREIGRASCRERV